MGRMDIDYAVLEDAFLRYQTKPRLSMHGDLYYEVGAIRGLRVCCYVYTYSCPSVSSCFGRRMHAPLFSCLHTY